MGAHKIDFIRTFHSITDVEDMYGPYLYDNARIVTLAPEQVQFRKQMKAALKNKS